MKIIIFEELKLFPEPIMQYKLYLKVVYIFLRKSFWQIFFLHKVQQITRKSMNGAPLGIRKPKSTITVYIDYTTSGWLKRSLK